MSAPSPRRSLRRLPDRNHPARWCTDWLLPLREFVARLPVADLAEFRIVEFFIAVRTPSRILRRRATVWAVVLASQPHHADAAMHPWHNWRLGEGHSGGYRIEPVRPGGVLVGPRANEVHPREECPSKVRPAEVRLIEVRLVP